MWIKLVTLMAEKGLSGQELAKMLDVHENTISRLRTGKSEPTMKTLGKLADALGVERKELL